ncbi:hypothetical protein [Moraxella sp. ZY210820]|uniref:hypothetical protein n=1 Tax=unclassified Moraxella TaxID=2685852 RepID=UPI00272FA115|nr:hypothetical protein [Moraxella sp. ZY210820]WLF82868.1 hypothetical protein LU301_06130 [Moraxella sp. ZY210820]
MHLFIPISAFFSLFFLLYIHSYSIEKEALAKKIFSDKTCLMVENHYKSTFFLSDVKQVYKCRDGVYEINYDLEKYR